MVLAGGCGAPAPAPPAASDTGTAAPGDHPGDDTAEPGDTGWPSTAPGWTPGLTLVHDGQVLADGATLTVETAPAGISAPSTLAFTVTNRSDVALTLDADPAAWLSGEGWTWAVPPPAALDIEESASFSLSIDPAGFQAAATAAATLTVPVEGGPTATLVADVRRPLRAVVTGTGGAVWTSDDYGRTWTEAVASDGSDDTALGLAWGDGRFVRADRDGANWADPGTYAWSDDGEVWTTSTYADEFWASDCAHGADRFFCVRGSSITWTATGETILFEAESWGGHLNAVTWAGDRFVAVGRSGRRVTSLDGSSWDTEDFWSDGDSFNGIGHADGRIVAVGGSDRLAIATSTDAGATWSEQVLCTDRYARFEAVTALDGTWLATAQANGCPRLWTSADGTTWTAHTYDSGIRVLGVTRDVFVAAGEGWGQPSRLLWSADGLTWTESLSAPEGVGIARLAIEQWEGP